MEKVKAMIIVKDGLEECEALLTYDLLYRAGILTDLVGSEKEVISSHNVSFKVHKLLNEINPEDYDCLILPGGMPGTINLQEDEKVQELIDFFVEKDKYIAAICAAPSILIKKNLLKNNKFVVYPGFESGMIPAEGKSICDRKIITGKGLGAGFEFAYLIISKLINEEKAKEVMQKVQF